MKPVAKDSKATPEASVEKTEEAAENSGIDINPESLPKNNADVSDDALKAAYVEESDAPDVSVKEKDKVGEEEVEKNKEDEKDEEDDSLDESILEEIRNQDKEKLSEKEDRPELNKVKELERKLEALEKQTKVPNVPGVEPYSEEFYEKVGEKYGVDAQQAKAFILMSEDAISTGIKPAFDELKSQIDGFRSKDVLEKTNRDLEKDKLYSVLKDEIKDVLKTDPDIKDLPDSPSKLRLALSRAKDRNIEKVIKAAKKKARKQSEDNRRVMPSDKGTVGKSIVKDDSLKLSQEDLKLAKDMGMSLKDIKGLSKIPDSFVEE